MKKKLFLSLIITAVISSCASTKYAEYIHTEDYSKYSKEGFYIYPQETSNTSLTYTPLTNIHIFIQAGKPEKGQNLQGLSIIKEGDPHTFADMAIPTYEYMLDKIVNEAKKVGANAIINFKYNGITNEIMGLAVKLEK